MKRIPELFQRVRSAQMRWGSVELRTIGCGEDGFPCRTDLLAPVAVSRSFPTLALRTIAAFHVRHARFVSFILIGFCIFGSFQVLADPGRRTEPVYGAGPSTRVVALFFKHFSQHPAAAGVEFLVPERSTKHAGGIRASDQYLFGRTGRPLTEQEKALDKCEILLGRVPVGFATGPAVKLPPLGFPDIERIFSRQVTNWNDLGGPDAPIVLLGREKSEAVLLALSKHFPSLVDAEYQQILKRDHAVVNYLRSPGGRYAISFGALSNFSDLNVIDLEGQSLGVDVGLVVDKKNLNHPLVNAVRQYADDEEWRRRVEGAGYFAAVHTTTIPREGVRP